MTAKQRPDSPKTYLKRSFFKDRSDSWPTNNPDYVTQLSWMDMGRERAKLHGASRWNAGNIQVSHIPAHCCSCKTWTLPTRSLTVKLRWRRPQQSAFKWPLFIKSWCKCNVNMHFGLLRSKLLLLCVAMHIFKSVFSTHKTCSHWTRVRS